MNVDCLFTTWLLICAVTLNSPLMSFITSVLEDEELGFLKSCHLAKRSNLLSDDLPKLYCY